MQIQSRTESGEAAHRTVLVVLMLHASTFILMSVDLMARVWSWRGKLQSRDVMALMFFEVSRSVVTAGALALLAWMLVRRRGREWRALALAIAFAAVWHTKAFGFAGFPGARQEAVALWLIEHHVSQGLLAVLFGSPAWALCGAVLALLRFSAVYPEPHTRASILASHGRDRAGLMRTAGMAGADIGSMFRHLSANMMQRGLFAPRVLIPAGIAWAIVFQMLGQFPAVVAIGIAILAVLSGIIVTNLRATMFATQSKAVQASVGWLGRAAWTSAVLFAASAAATFALRGPASFAGVVLLGVAPVSALYCTWEAVRRGQ